MELNGKDVPCFLSPKYDDITDYKIWGTVTCYTVIVPWGVDIDVSKVHSDLEDAVEEAHRAVGEYMDTYHEDLSVDICKFTTELVVYKEDDREYTTDDVEAIKSHESWMLYEIGQDSEKCIGSVDGTTSITTNLREERGRKRQRVE